MYAIRSYYGALAFRGAGFALKTQIPIMVLIALSILALAGGSLVRGGMESLFSSYPPPEVGFWAVFAIFFPAVTGVMAGRITSYNVCYTKLLRTRSDRTGDALSVEPLFRSNKGFF